jgi:hypothetical protein
MSELQPGMLALVIGCKNVHENLGKIVELDRFVMAGEIALDAPARDNFWVIKGEGIGYTLGGRTIIGSIGLAKPKHLLPIKPESDPLDVTHKEELHA